MIRKDDQYAKVDPEDLRKLARAIELYNAETGSWPEVRYNGVTRQLEIQLYAKDSAVHWILG